MTALIPGMNATLTPKSALLLAAITVTAIDGDLDEREVAIINRLDGFNTSDDWDTAIAVWNEMSVDQCIPLVASNLDPKQQRVVMANLVDIAMADGFLDEAENILLREKRRLLRTARFLNLVGISANRIRRPDWVPWLPDKVLHPGSGCGHK